MKTCMKTILKFLALLAVLTATYRRDLARFRHIPFMDINPAYLPDRTFYLGHRLNQPTNEETENPK